MKNIKTAIVALSTLGMAMASTLTMSECRTDMGAEMFAECITIEGSGANYQDWRSNYEQAMGGPGGAHPEQMNQSRSAERMLSRRGTRAENNAVK